MTVQTPQELVQRLIAAGFSQAAIAERAGVKQPTISRILSGAQDPKSSVLIRLSRFASEVGATGVNETGDRRSRQERRAFADRREKPRQGEPQ